MQVFRVFSLLSVIVFFLGLGLVSFEGSSTIITIISNFLPPKKQLCMQGCCFCTVIVFFLGLGLVSFEGSSTIITIISNFLPPKKQLCMQGCCFCTVIVFFLGLGLVSFEGSSTISCDCMTDAADWELPSVRIVSASLR